MTRPIPLILVALLAACGVDGAPAPPAEREPTPFPQGGTSISVTGSAEIGITGSL